MRVLQLFLSIALLLEISSCFPSIWPASASAIGEATVDRPLEPALEPPSHNGLRKRRGGGGGGGRGGGGSSGGGGGGGSRGGGESGGGGSSGNRGTGGSSPPSYSSSSNAGGQTAKGSGSPRTYAGAGGSVYYRGGSANPFPAFRSSPSGISPYTIQIGAAAIIFGGVWTDAVAGYPFTKNVTFRNSTSHHDETLPALCLCQLYLVCGCDENHDQTYLNHVANEASNSSTSSRVSRVNGTTTLVINGTLANGTTSPGGTEPSSAGAMRSSGTPTQSLGIWLLAGAILWGGFLL